MSEQVLSEKVALVLEAALKLTREERADLLDALAIARSRDDEKLPFDEEWVEEIERRTGEWDRGEVRSSPGDDVERRLRKRISDGG